MSEPDDLEGYEEDPDFEKLVAARPELFDAGDFEPDAKHDSAYMDKRVAADLKRMRADATKVDQSS
jgi:hypothetical protein